MNDKRRKRLQEACMYIESASDIVESVLDDERDALDNVPENLQQSERYSSIEDAVCALEYAYDSLGSALGDVQTAIG